MIPPHFTDSAVAFHWPIALFFAASCFALGYPGRLNADSLYSVITMAAPGDVGNWHSPTLGWWWSLPGGVLGQPAGALLMQAALFGLSAGFMPCVAATLRGRATIAFELALRVVLTGVFVSIGKDVVVLGALLLIVQMVRHGLHAPIRPWQVTALMGLVAFVLLIKAPNFLVFVLAFAVLLGFFTRSFGLYVALVAVALLIGILAVPLNRTIDRLVFHAKDLHPDKQLVIFDLAALSLATDSNAFAAVPGWPTATLPPVAHCFMPNMWDSFAPWGPCRGYATAYDALDAPLKRQWGAQILAHPLAYASHRLRYAGELLRSQDHASWGISGAAINDAVSPAARIERQEMMGRLKASRPIALVQDGPVTAPFQWLERMVFKFPKMPWVGLFGSLAVVVLNWLRRRDGLRMGAVLPASLGVGNFGMLLVFGVADPARYMLPTICLCYVALLALFAPARSDGPAEALRSTPALRPAD